MVDHRAVHPVRAVVVGSLGVPPLEGMAEGHMISIHPLPQLLHMILSAKAFHKI